MIIYKRKTKSSFFSQYHAALQETKLKGGVLGLWAKVISPHRKTKLLRPKTKRWSIQEVKLKTGVSGLWAKVISPHIKTCWVFLTLKANCSSDKTKNVNLIDVCCFLYGAIYMIDQVPFMHTRCKLILDPTSSVWIIHMSHGQLPCTGHLRNCTTVTRCM